MMAASLIRELEDRRSLGRCRFVLALCLAALAACGGVARGDKQSAATSGAAGVAGGGAGSMGVSTGGAVGMSGAVPGGAAGVDVQQDGGAGAAGDGGLPCGAANCTASQICVHRQCGGGPVQCMAETDAGCPMGWHADFCPSGQFGNQTACVPDPCTPPAAECVDIPAMCAAELSCSCLDRGAVCLGPGCQSLIGLQVTCNGAD